MVELLTLVAAMIGFLLVGVQVGLFLHLRAARETVDCSDCGTRNKVPRDARGPRCRNCRSALPRPRAVAS